MPETAIPHAASPLLLRLRAFPLAAALALALAAGALAALGFAPRETVAAPILGTSLWLLLLAARPERGFALGFAFGLGHFIVGLTWIATAFTYQSAMPPMMGWVAVVGLSAFLALYPALAAYAATRLTARIVPLCLLLAGLFILTEILRGLLFSGFAWNPLGAAWLQLEGVAALAAIIGANGLSGLVILSGGGLAALLAARGARGRLALVAVFPLLLAIGFIVPAARPADAPTTGQKLILVQPNIGQDEKLAPGGFDESLTRLVRLSEAALARDPDASAIIWPEAAIEYALEDEPGLRQRLAQMLRPGQYLLTGGIAIIRDEGGEAVAATNSVFALDHLGAIRMRYDKAHLVPGGEYLPLRAIAEPLGLARLVPGSLDFQPGPGPETFALPGLPPFGPAICYEIIFPGAIVDSRQRPDWILTLSNDAWFGPSGPPQHFAQARLRAIEEGLPVVRATPTGISGLIGADGATRALLPAHQPATLAVQLPAARPATPFASLGLAAPALFAFLLIGIGLLGNRPKI